MKLPKAETTVLAPGALPALEEFEAEERVEPDGGASVASHRELARLWSELLAAAPTDARARQFVAYFRPDAERIFAAAGTPGK